MHIVIIGAGIAGLSTYLFLRKHLPADQGHTVTIYEAHDLQPYVASIISKEDHRNRADGTQLKPGCGQHGDIDTIDSLAEQSAAPASFTPETIGSAIGISLNGLNVLSRIATTGTSAIGGATPDNTSSTQLMESILRGSHPVHTWRMSSARGWKLADIKMVPKGYKPPLGTADQQSSGSATGVTGIMISRQVFWQTLLAEVVSVVSVDPDRRLEQVLKQGRVEGMVWRQGVDSRSSSRIHTKGRKVKIIFDDGRQEEADLVIGADGVRSAVRKAMFEPRDGQGATTTADESNHHDGDGTKLADAVTSPASISTGPGALLKWLRSFWRPPSEGSAVSAADTSQQHGPDYVSPKYEGLAGVGGIIPASILRSAQPPLQPGTQGIVFGANGFFGYGYITSSLSEWPDRPTLHNVPSHTEPGSTAVWWSTFGSKEEHPYALPAQEDGKRPRPWDFDRPAAMAALLARHRSWNDPVIQAILDYIESCDLTDNGQEKGSAVEGFYPTWTTPWLPTWHKGTVVLIGDSAHSMQPSSGQGACQALEDAETLAICLGYMIRQALPKGKLKHEVEGPRCEAALKVYEKIRMPRVKEIYDRSQRMSRMKDDMGVVAEYMMYAFIKLMTLLGPLLRDDSMEKLLTYDLPKEVGMALELEDSKEQ